MITEQNTDRLSPEAIQDINEDSVRGFDKWHRMFCGIASKLSDYRNDILHLEIRNTEKRFSSSLNTAVHFVQKWIDHNVLLKNAKGYVVMFYSQNTKNPQQIYSGFVTDANFKEELGIPCVLKEISTDSQSSDYLKTDIPSSRDDEATFAQHQRHKI